MKASKIVLRVIYNTNQRLSNEPIITWNKYKRRRLGRENLNSLFVVPDWPRKRMIRIFAPIIDQIQLLKSIQIQLLKIALGTSENCFTVVGFLWFCGYQSLCCFVCSEYGDDLCQRTAGASANCWWTKAVGGVPQQENYTKRAQNKEPLCQVMNSFVEIRDNTECVATKTVETAKGQLSW